MKAMVLCAGFLLASVTPSFAQYACGTRVVANSSYVNRGYVANNVVADKFIATPFAIPVAVPVAVVQNPTALYQYDYGREVDRLLARRLARFEQAEEEVVEERGRLSRRARRTVETEEADEDAAPVVRERATRRRVVEDEAIEDDEIAVPEPRLERRRRVIREDEEIEDDEIAEDEIEFTNTPISILATNGCAECHTVGRAKGGFELFDRRGRLLADVDREAVYEAVASGRMPKGGRKIARADREILRAWAREPELQ